MIAPTDFQSMGFGLPAAIGAKCAAPVAEVVACIGDGGLLQTATELQTAVRESLDLTVVVFNDGRFGYIERQQVAEFGAASGVDLGSVDYPALAEAFGCTYFDASAPEFSFAPVLGTAGVKLVDLPLGDPPSVRLLRARSRARATARRAIGPVWIRRLKGWLGR
jgi:acetolactate synthase-1/2/3 large subunit